MRVLAVTKVFPNAVVPLDEPHVAQRYASVQGRCEISVLGTIPTFPLAPLLGRWSHAGRVAGAPRREVIRGLEVEHPRYLLIPKVGLPVQWLLYAAGIFRAVLARRAETDVLWSTWVYPDGVAALWVGQLLGLPVVVESIGSDVNIVAQKPPARALLRRFLPGAARVIAVSRPLAEKLIELGAAPERVDVIPTGVNRELFAPRDRGQARARLGRDDGERLVLFVGRTERAKGVFDLLEAFRQVVARDPAARLVYVGQGEAQAELAARAAAFGERVLLTGGRPLPEVAEWIGACDLLALPSWAEGTPNVILEALSAGRRVVASSVGGIPDLITSARLGELVPARDVGALGGALARQLATSADPEEIRRESGVLSLDEVAARLEESLERARDRGPAPRVGLSGWVASLLAGAEP